MVSFINEYKSNKKVNFILSKYIPGFIKYLRDNKIVNDRSSYIALKHIEGFNKYLFYAYSKINIEDINENIIEKYKQFCYYELKNNNKTINYKLNSLGKFFKYLSKNLGLYEYNILLNVSKLKNEEEKKPTIISISQLNCIFNTMRSNIYGIRDICISKIILSTGLKINDVLNLELSAIHISDSSCYIELFKNNVAVQYPISSELAKDIRDYLLVRSTFNYQSISKNKVFLSESGKKYNIRSYQLFFKEAVARNDFSPSFTPRSLRSTFLYNMSRVVSEDKLQEIASQKKVRQYYELKLNPLSKII